MPLYFLIYGLLTLAGGIIGYVKAASVASLIAGSISGLLLIAFSQLHAKGKRWARYGLLVISTLLLGRFMGPFMETQQWMPAGMMTILSTVGIVLVVLRLTQSKAFQTKPSRSL